MKQRGFTLIELLISIAIIGLLSSVVLLSVGVARDKASDSKYKAELTQLRNALELYYIDNGHYPTMNPACWNADWVYSNCGTTPFILDFDEFTDFSWLKSGDYIMYTTRVIHGQQSYKLVVDGTNAGELVPRSSPWSYCPTHCTGWCASNYSAWHQSIYVISSGAPALCSY